MILVRRRGPSLGHLSDHPRRRQEAGRELLPYLRDRIGGARQMPSLAGMIRQRAQDLQLGASWAPP